MLSVGGLIHFPFLACFTHPFMCNSFFSGSSDFPPPEGKY